MIIINHIKEMIKNFSPNNLVYFFFPIVLLIILYASFFPFNQNYIGDWHDIHANSMYFSLLSENYFTTWNNLWAGGFPVIASPNSDKYYLLSFPLYLIFKDLSIVNFIILLHVLIAYFAFFKLASLVTKNYNLIMIFSLFFAFSGIIFGRFETGHHLLLYGIAWIPLLYYFFLKIVVFDEATIKNASLFSIVSVLIYFTGNIYYFIFAYLIILVFCLYYTINKQLSRKILYYLVLSIILTTLLFSIKFIPDFGVSSSIIRQDIIDPLEGGGSVENDLASFILGTGISSSFSKEETTVMIGVVPILLLIIGLIYGRKEITIPSYFAILFSIIWAGGGKTIVSFIHFLPFVNNFRVPGRIFGAILPIVLVIALYGVVILYQKAKSGEVFEISSEQKRNIILGLAGVIIVKFLELPFQETITIETLIPVILIGGFIFLVYSRRGSFKNIIYFFIFAIVVNVFLIMKVNAIPTGVNLIKLLLAGILLFVFFIYTVKSTKKSANYQIFCGVLLISVLLMIMGNIGFVTTFTPPFKNSPAIDVIREIKQQPSENIQLWVLENGWAYQHTDFTYWDIINRIHPMNLYQAYYLKTMPMLSYTIGNITYFSADYIIDTQYLENGNQNLPEYTFKVKNISVYKPEHVLPNVFFIRNSQVYPLTIEKFSPDEVIASGELLQGDVVILKGAYYPGWKANGADAEPVGNMIGTKLPSNTEKIRFNFDPLDYKMGAFLSGCGIILIIALIIKRKEIEEYVAKRSEPVASSKSKKKKRQ
jgi:MFS family permease